MKMSGWWGIYGGFMLALVRLSDPLPGFHAVACLGLDLRGGWGAGIGLYNGIRVEFIHEENERGEAWTLYLPLLALAWFRFRATEGAPDLGIWMPA